MFLKGQKREALSAEFWISGSMLELQEAKGANDWSFLYASCLANYCSSPSPVISFQQFMPHDVTPLQVYSEHAAH